MKVLISAVLALLAAPMGALFGFLAQASSGSSTDSVPFATLVVQLGLSAVFLWQWQSERKERAAAQQQLTTFLEKFGPVLADAIAALRDVKTSLVQTVERVDAIPDRSDYQQALRRLERISDEISDVVRDREGRQR